MRFKSLFCGLLVCTLAALPALASPVEREEKKIELTDERALEVNVDFGAGNLEIASGPSNLVLDARVEYEPRYVDFFADYRKRGDVGVLDLSSELHHSMFDNDIKNTWRMGLTDQVPIELTMDVGAADADLDFTNLKLTGADLDVGAADASIWWDRPNPVSMRELRIDCGASSLKMSGLGNANFRRFNFDGGVGSFELDFGGEWQQSAEALIDVGLGSLDITIPANVGVRIETDGSFLSSVDVDRRYRRMGDGVYESENYDTAEIRLDFLIKLGMGSVDIRSTRR